ncbi:MAG: type II toxin-antitoxin system death-on-curing family toxin [Gemmatimonadales bacterium]|nr:MAG: type II toxin-antitoxin system death-on-curing family toxin [Gemmatimonadales bacterium]
MTEPRWPTFSVVLAIHADQISKHGGSAGLRDRGLLESALERPRNRFHYEPDSDLAGLAASYGFGIARNHPFVDGNKRVAFQAMYVFLGLNGLRIESSEEEVVGLVVSLAGGQLDEPQLTSWLRENTVPR